MGTSTSDVIVIATANAKSGKEAELEHAWREIAILAREQTGCIQFSLYRSTGARPTISVLERWATEEDHQRHLQGAHVQQFMGRLADIVAGPPSAVSYEVLED